MSSSPIPQRREVLYRGHVQGVGFRYTSRSIARRYRIAGCVCNLVDGRVRLIVEGEADQIEAYLSDLASRMEGNIVEAEINSTTATGEYEGFEILPGRH